MIKRNRKIDDRIREMEEKVTDSKKRVYDRLDDLSELVDYEITDEIKETLMGIINLSSLNRKLNNDKNILILQRSFTPRIRWLLYKGKITSWVKKIIRIGD
jgi:hypothetical protein|tara:strand:+ start:835 stop:1137 length:303 start_codon:yes stop_codon:yes gene_type:complete